MQGANSHGQLGLGFASELCETPQKCPSTFFATEQLAKIAGGGSHTLFLTKTGRLFGCGWNHKGQLGIENAADQIDITEIDLTRINPVSDDDRVVDIACGWDSSAILTAHGVLYVFGSNAFGQLGFEVTQMKNTAQPRELPLPNAARVRAVSFGLRHLAIWSDDGDVYFVGKIKFTAHCKEIEWNDTKWWKLNANAGEIRAVASGQNHFVYADNENVYGIGDNRHGQCEKILIEGRLKRLLSGWTHNAAMYEDGRVRLWGRNVYGQLGCADPHGNGPIDLKLEATVQDLHLGSEHGLAVTENGAVFTWGWNEHGNCGNGSVQDV